MFLNLSYVTMVMVEVGVFKLLAATVLSAIGSMLIAISRCINNSSSSSCICSFMEISENRSIFMDYGINLKN